MTLCKRILSVLTLLLGLVGSAGCVAAIVGVWNVSTRLSQATENVFGQIDGSLVVVQERVAQTQDRVEAAKITTESIEKSLRDWTKREASESLASRLNAAEKVERLASSLQQVDHWLEVSESSVELVQQVLSMGRSTGAPMDTTSVDGLVEEIASLRIRLAEATELVVRIRGRTAEASGKKSLEEQVEQVVQLALRVVAALGSIGSRLEEFEGRLSETRKSVQGLKTGALRWILGVTIGVTLLLLWMAAGQVALCRLAWNGLLRTRRPPREGNASPPSTHDAIA